MDRRVQKLISLLEKDFEQRHSFRDLAELVNLSPSRLRHLFKAEVGVSVRGYQNFLRMEKAKELVETSFLSIKQIRNMLGVTDKSRFAQRFRKAYGATPSRHRIGTPRT